MIVFVRAHLFQENLAVNFTIHSNFTRHSNSYNCLKIFKFLNRLNSPNSTIGIHKYLELQLFFIQNSLRKFWLQWFQKGAVFVGRHSKMVLLLLAIVKWSFVRPIICHASNVGLASFRLRETGFTAGNISLYTSLHKPFWILSSPEAGNWTPAAHTSNKHRAPLVNLLSS